MTQIQAVSEREKDRYKTTKKTTLIGALVNFCLSVLKLIIGTIGQSPALVADGVHSFSDLISDFLVLIIAKYASVEADENHPYGHHRIETFGTALIGLFLILLGAGIIFDAAWHMANHELYKPDILTLIVGVLSIFANLGLFIYTRNIATRIRSDLLKANADHSKGDALSSLIVVIGIAGALAGFLFLDAVAAIVVGLMIFKMGAKWFGKAIYDLSDAGLDNQNLIQIKNIINNTEGVLHMHLLRTRKMGPHIFLDVHIEIPPYISASEGHYIAECVRISLMKKYSQIVDVTVHVDIEDHPEGLPDKMLLSRSEIMAKFEPAWNKILPYNALMDLRLHYVDYKIDIELVLDYELVKHLDLNKLSMDLNNSIKNTPEIHKITGVFSV